MRENALNKSQERRKFNENERWSPSVTIILPYLSTKKVNVHHY